MDAKQFNRLQERLPEAHLSQRLIRQTEHIAMRFDVHGMRLFDFFWENFDFMPKALEVVLKLSGLMKRASANALLYRLQEFDIPIEKLPLCFDEYRILHLSDLHIDEVLDGGERLCRTVAGLEYDLCILTGDFRFDTYGVYDKVMSRMTRLMKILDCSDGVVGILGNHDFIEMVPDFEAMGIKMLLNESLPIKRGEHQIWFVGLDDVHYYGVDDLARAMENVDSSQPVVLLVHSPEVIEKAAACGIDLYLCGHTHGGQVCLPGGIPIIGNARCPRNKLSGRWRHGRMQGYTHRGTGTSGLPVRINCPPDISIHRLIPSQ